MDFIKKIPSDTPLSKLSRARGIKIINKKIKIKVKANP